jgi:phenylacetate-CoA ligase
VHENRTSGSTGEPVIVKRTAVCQLFWLANTMREYFWHERDFSWRFTAIRPQFTQYAVRPNWGQPANLLFETGPGQSIPITTDIVQQVAWIKEFDPHVLLVYPNVLDGILRHCRARAIRFRSLKLIRSISESLSPHLREEAASFFGVRIVDNYSSQEAGIIAVQCPDGDAYHVMAESVIVEVLDEKGRACAPGETGRVVVTDLHNFATPIVRYDIGDYAQVAPPCACGRGLPALKRIVGRERNLIRKPDGTRHYPLVGFAKFREVAPVVQYQVIQHDLERLEVRLVTEVPLTASQEEALRDIIVEALGYPFQIGFSYFPDRIPRGTNGKFDEFVCLVPGP